jgi:hypothetical protein
MTAFPRTRTAARYALRHTSSDLTRHRAAPLLRQLGTGEAAPAGTVHQTPARPTSAASGG